MGEEQKEWYSNQQLYEMMVELSKRLENTDAELGKTQVLIRDYNGLRSVINECRTWQNNYDKQQEAMEKQKEAAESKTHFGWEKMGYVFGALGVIVAIVSLVV